MQVSGLVLSAVGIPLTILALWRAWQTRDQPTPARRVLANGHVFSHGVMLYMQIAFALINVLVLLSPEIPAAMVADHEGSHAVLVIVVRKCVRLSMQVVLTGAVLYKRVERHHLLLTTTYPSQP